MPSAEATRPEIELWLELETDCNLECGFCFNYWKDGSSSLPPRRLSTSDFLTSVDELAGIADIRVVAVSGGEPLLRPDLDEILANFRARGTEVALVTNGLLLTPRRANELRRLGVATFQIPLHAARPDIHDQLCGKPCWTGTLRALVTARETGANVVPVFVATRQNCAEFAAVVELCALLGLRAVLFNQFVPGGAGLRNRLALEPSPAAIEQALIDGDRLAHRLGIRIELGVPVRLSEGAAQGLLNTRLRSCCISVAQKKWTLDCEGRLRRCNQEGTPVSIAALIKSASRASTPPRGVDAAVSPCHFITRLC